MYEYSMETLGPIFEKWRGLLRLKESWDVRLELIDDPEFRKTGDLKIDPDDRKAILMLNVRNPRQENPEEVICHELMHLKMYPLDQLTEGLIDSHYKEGTPEYRAAYRQFGEPGDNRGGAGKVLACGFRGRQGAVIWAVQGDEVL